MQQFIKKKIQAKELSKYFFLISEIISPYTYRKFQEHLFCIAMVRRFNEI